MLAFKKHFGIQRLYVSMIDIHHQVHQYGQADAKHTYQLAQTVLAGEPDIVLPFGIVKFESLFNRRLCFLLHGTFKIRRKRGGS